MPVPAGPRSARPLYATLEEFKAGRRVTSADDDAALLRALTAACRQIDRRTGRRFYLDPAPTTRVFGVTGRSNPDGLLLVDDIGLLDGLVVENGSSAAWTATTDYEAGPDNALSLGWPVTELRAVAGGRWSGWWSGPQVRVTAYWGWPEVPEEINMAALILANRLYMRKDSPEGVAGSAEWGAIRLSRLDPDVEALIAPYVIIPIA